MARKKNNILDDTSGAKDNYCQKCWNEFTCLTEQERKNLKKILSGHGQVTPVVKRKCSTRNVLCIETGIIYESLRECCYYTGASYTQLSKHCRLGHPDNINGLHFKYIEY